MRRLVVDTSNLLFRVAAANSRYNAGSEDMAGLAMHSALMTLRKYYRDNKPDQIALAFEGANNWRKTYTRSSECVSRRVYKANRVKDSSMDVFFELIKDFEALARQHTSLVCLSNDILEGDDLIAGYVQRFAPQGDEVMILSGDKDFMQLLHADNIKLINPDNGKDRRKDPKWDPAFNAKYFMFEKCFRGDSGDNVLPAYPRVRSTRIKQAWENEFHRTNIMNETWQFVDPNGGDPRELRVGDLFKENELLMDLTKQPSYVRTAIDETLDHALVSYGKFSFFHFQKWCGKYGLNQVAEHSHDFAEMFSVNGRTAKAAEPKTEPIIEKKSSVAAGELRKRGLVF
jgi:hypothetical protein